MKFNPEYERLKDMGATQDTVEDAFRETADPITTTLKQININSIPYDKNESTRMRDYEITIRYFLSHDMPTYDKLASEIGKGRASVGIMINRFLTKQLGITESPTYKELYKRIGVLPANNMLAPYKINASRFKKELYEKVLEKIMDADENGR
jgi:hypothetical protein